MITPNDWLATWSIENGDADLSVFLQGPSGPTLLLQSDGVVTAGGLSAIEPGLDESWLFRDPPSSLSTPRRLENYSELGWGNESDVFSSPYGEYDSLGSRSPFSPIGLAGFNSGEESYLVNMLSEEDAGASASNNTRCQSLMGDKAEPSKSPSRTKFKIPKDATELLKTWLHAHADNPYPTEKDKQYLVTATGLTPMQISNWMINARRRILKAPRGGKKGARAKEIEKEKEKGAGKEESVTAKGGPDKQGDKPRCGSFLPGQSVLCRQRQPVEDRNYIGGGNQHNYHGSSDSDLLSRSGIDSSLFLNQFLGVSYRCSVGVGRR